MRREEVFLTTEDVLGDLVVEWVGFEGSLPRAPGAQLEELETFTWEFSLLLNDAEVLRRLEEGVIEVLSVLFLEGHRLRHGSRWWFSSEKLPLFTRWQFHLQPAT